MIIYFAASIKSLNEELLIKNRLYSFYDCGFKPEFLNKLKIIKETETKDKSND